MSDFMLRRFIDRPEWIADAACSNEDTNLFYPTPSQYGRRQPSPATREQIRRAKTVCRRCDVQAECLAYAMETGEDHGIWGGLDEDQRRQLRRSEGRRARGIRPLSQRTFIPKVAS